jgi:hypothetical protein
MLVRERIRGHYNLYAQVGGQQILSDTYVNLSVLFAAFFVLRHSTANILLL